MSLSTHSERDSGNSSRNGEQSIRCRKCELANLAKHIRIDGEGPVPAEILLVGMNPGWQEDHVGRNFVGPAGGILNKTLNTLSLDREKIRIVNAIRCFHGRGSNKIKLTDVHIRACRDYLINEIWAVNPRFIIATGEIALHALLDRKVKIGKYIETVQQETISGKNVPVIPVIHPASLLHTEEGRSNEPERLRYQKSWEMVGKYMDGEAYDMRDIGEYIHVDTPEQIQECIDLVMATKSFTFDFETGVPPITKEERELEGNKDKRALRVWTQENLFIKCLSISPRPKLSYVIDPRKANTPLELIRIMLAPIFLSKEILKIAHNIKFDMSCAERFLGYRFTRDIPIYDPMNSHFLIAEEESHALSSLAWKFTKIGGYDAKVKELGGEIGAASTKVDGKDLYDYNGGDSDVCHRIAPITMNLMRQERVDGVYKKIIEPAIHSLYRMERKGVLIDKPLLHRYDHLIYEEMFSVDNKLQNYPEVRAYLAANTDKEWGPRKKYIRDILFGTAGFNYPVIKKTKSKSGAAFDAEVKETLILKHDSKFVFDLLLFSDLADLRRKNVRKLIYLCGSDGRVHTVYAIHIARTGRTSSENPNLQNIPQPFKKEHLHDIFQRYNVRKAFIPDPGYEWGSVDYSQHELRIMAALSGCPVLSQVFIEDKDPHNETTITIFEITEDGITKERRRIAKTVNFGIGYLMTAWGLARELNILQYRLPPENRHYFTDDDAQDFINKWFNKYYGVKAYVQEVAKFIAENKYIVTPTGRKRRFPFIDKKILREAVNTPIQGTASDLLIIALNRIWEAVDKYRFKSHPILETHDSIDFCIWPPEKNQLIECVSEIMVNPPVDFMGKVPLAVDWSFGSNMGEISEVEV